MDLKIEKSQIMRKNLYINGMLVSRRFGSYINCNMCNKYLFRLPCYSCFDGNDKYIKLCKDCYVKIYILTQLKNEIY